MRLPVLLLVNFVLILIATGIKGIPTAPACAAEGPLVDVLIGQGASDLERYAAQQLCYYLKEVYGVTSKPSLESHTEAHTSLIVGQPMTNPAVARALGSTSWPEISDQGIVLQPAQLDEKPALIIVPL